MKQLLNDFSKVVEESSGALSYSLIQAFVMGAAFIRLGKLSGYKFGILFTCAALATLGLFMCVYSVGKVINEVAAERKANRMLLYILLYPVLIGVLLSAVITMKALFQ